MVIIVLGIAIVRVCDAMGLVLLRHWLRVLLGLRVLLWRGGSVRLLHGEPLLLLRGGVRLGRVFWLPVLRGLLVLLRRLPVLVDLRL